MLTVPSFKKSLIREQFQGNCLKLCYITVMINLNHVFLVTHVNVHVLSVYGHFQYCSI